ncbi:hypothetical protein [Oceanobacillus halophilus]|uniref:GNAT family N-acetyltransferase n=1 Tax=Oceanobacillus halophilus TaxID=930130 RepID=A0A495A4G1_9BACI|nr:hypothetical protein [Oceanobacillus halophilus]RKQ34387.1 hypothetical protein D8M06_08430 [Oceanobacillus halophilus]
MNIIPAKKANKEQLDDFFTRNDNLDRDGLIQNGFVVEMDSKIEGCFILNQVEEGVYWLKQLYITRTEANKLPVLLESILTIAKSKQARSVYVHSHQPVVDIILEALQFHPQKKSSFVDKHPIDKGNWWSYNVS